MSFPFDVRLESAERVAAVSLRLFIVVCVGKESSTWSRFAMLMVDVSVETFKMLFLERLRFSFVDYGIVVLLLKFCYRLTFISAFYYSVI